MTEKLAVFTGKLAEAGVLNETTTIVNAITFRKYPSRK